MLTRAPRPHTGGAAVSYVPDGPFVTSPRTYARALGPRRVDRLHLPLPLPGKATIESAPHRAADACCGGWPGLAWPPSSGTDQPPDCGEVSKASQPASSRGGRVWQRPNCRRPVRCVCVPAPRPCASVGSGRSPPGPVPRAAPIALGNGERPACRPGRCRGAARRAPTRRAGWAACACCWRCAARHLEATPYVRVTPQQQRSAC